MKQIINGIDETQRNKGKTTSDLVREMTRTNAQEYDFVSYVDHVWNTIGAELIRRGVTEKDLHNSIKKYRAVKIS